MKPITLGVIFSSRSHEANRSVEVARDKVLHAMKSEAILPLLFDAESSRAGCLATPDDAQRFAQWLQEQRGAIDGLLISLPQSGDTRLVVEALRGLLPQTPVLIHAFPDDLSRMANGERREAFGAKMALCGLLREAGIRFSLTAQHTVDPESEGFRKDLRAFAGTCRVIRGLRGARLGAVVDSEVKAVTQEVTGVTVERLEMADLFARTERIGAEDPRLRDKLDALAHYVPSRGAPDGVLEQAAKVGVALDEWTASSGLHAAAVSCGKVGASLGGVFPCALMSMMNSNLLPAACDLDAAGLLGFYALVLASGKPGAVVSWGSNYGTEPDKAVVSSCSNLPREMLLGERDSIRSSARIDYQDGAEGYGAVVGRMRASPLTYIRARASCEGQIGAYLGEGLITSDPLNMNGGYGVVHIPDIQKLLHTVSAGGYGSRIAICGDHVGLAVQDALGGYLGWNLAYHTGIFEWDKRGDPFRERV